MASTLILLHFGEGVLFLSEVFNSLLERKIVPDSDCKRSPDSSDISLADFYLYLWHYYDKIKMEIFTLPTNVMQSDNSDRQTYYLNITIYIFLQKELLEVIWRNHQAPVHVVSIKKSIKN